MNLSKIHLISFIFAAFVLIGGLFILSNHKIEALSLDGVPGVWVTTGGEGSNCVENILVGGKIGKDQEVDRTMSVCDTGGGSGGSTPPTEPTPPTPEPPISLTPNSATGSVTVIVNPPEGCTGGDVYASDKYCLIKIGESSCTAYLQWKIDPCGNSTVLVSTPATPVNKTISTAKEQIITNYPIEYSSRSFYFYKNGQPAHSIKIEARCTTGSAWNGIKCATPTDGGTWSTLTCSQTPGTPASTLTAICSPAGTCTGNAPTKSCPAVPLNAPTSSISVSPSSVTSGGRSTISWSSTNATSCTASGPWSNSGKLSGSGLTDPLTGTTTFTLTCTGNGQTSTDSATVTVTELTPTGTWSYPTPCPTACGTEQSTQTQTCTGGNGSCSGNAETKICKATAQCPLGTISVNLSASPVGPLTAPSATNLIWTTTGNPTSCDATSSSWSGTDIKNGDPVTHRSGMSAGTYTFGITCHKTGVVDAVDTVTVVVNPGGGNCPVPLTQDVTVQCDKNAKGEDAISGSVIRRQTKSAYPECVFQPSVWASDDCKYPGDGGGTKINGGWSDWSGISCGTETGMKTHYCSNPPPANGGLECLRSDGTRGISESIQYTQIPCSSNCPSIDETFCLGNCSTYCPMVCGVKCPSSQTLISGKCVNIRVTEN